jgi:transcriptional regulator with PAS, ATPase and Fis domain
MDGRISLLAMITDIHDRKLAEIAARDREQSLQQANIALLSRIGGRHQFGKIVGKSLAIQKIFELIANTAANDATAVIYGEPGTGKELVARAIHDMSDRREKQFVPIHCGAIPENLVESEFFGYKKGAFSGAGADKPGYLDFGDGGTLFLDEIGEISLHMQVKLLRVIEAGGYTPVGSSQIRHTDVRIIAATNRDLKSLIKQKLIREDFYYRIHILPIELPPLRARKEDIPLLADHFMSIHAGKRNVPPLTREMFDKLNRYDWPGNVRELQNVIIRYCNLRHLDFFEPSASKLQISKGHAAVNEVIPIDASQTLGELGGLVAIYEKQVILAALEQCRWRRHQAADLLKIDRKTLFNKMKRYGLALPNDPA